MRSHYEADGTEFHPYLERKIDRQLAYLNEQSTELLTKVGGYKRLFTDDTINEEDVSKFLNLVSEKLFLYMKEAYRMGLDPHEGITSSLIKKELIETCASQAVLKFDGWMKGDYDAELVPQGI